MKKRYRDADTFEQFLERARTYEDLWARHFERARLPDDLVERVGDIDGRWHLLALSADWCQDAVPTTSVIARLASRVPTLDLRVVDRDDNLDIMDAHLTNGSRSIPVVIAFDEDFRERGWWGPRPQELQAWVMEEGRDLPSDERYRRIRRWHARDRGRTTLEEVVEMLERAAERMAA